MANGRPAWGTCGPGDVEVSASVAELEELTGATIRLQSESLYAPDQFDVILM